MHRVRCHDSAGLCRGRRISRHRAAATQGRAESAVSQRNSGAGVQHPSVSHPDGESNKCPVLRLMQDVPEYKSRGLADTFEMVFGDIYRFQQKQIQGRPLVKGWSVGETYMAGDVSIVKHVMTSDDCPMSRHPRALMGSEGVLFLNGEEHARIRGFMSPSFSKDEIEKYTPKVQMLVTKYLEQLVDASVGGRSTLAHPYLRYFTFDVICAVVVGLNLPPHELQDMLKDYQTFTAGVAFNSLPVYHPLFDLPFLPRGRAISAKARIVKKLDAIVTEAHEKLENGENILGLGLLQEFVAAGAESQQPLTRNQIIDNMFLFLLAGFDTTANLLSALIANADKYPQQWQAVVREQEQLAAQYGPQLTSQVLKEMKATENFVKETMRLKLPVPQTMRTASKDMTWGGHPVTEGSKVYIPFQYLAMNDPLWMDQTGDLAPDVFNPDRFIGVSPGATQQLGFGYGTHSCLGQALAIMEAKVALAELARGYEVVVKEEPRWVNMPFTQCANGLPVVVTRKQPAVGST